MNGGVAALTWGLAPTTKADRSPAVNAGAGSRSSTPRPVRGTRARTRFEELNRRRIELIDKEYAAGLSEAEEAELERLQQEAARLMDVLHPPPAGMLDELEALAARLEAQADPQRP